MEREGTISRVLKRIRMSYHRVQLRTYQASRWIRRCIVDIVAAADLPQAGEAGPHLGVVDPGLAVAARARRGPPAAGPTRLISPLMTLSSCGSSSRLVWRRKRPIGVTRGSSLELEVALPFGPRRGLVGQQPGQDLVGVRHHGAELAALEQLAVPADAVVAEQAPPRRDLCTCQAMTAMQRCRRQQQEQAAGDDVEAALQRLRPGPRQIVVDAQGQQVLRRRNG